MVSLRLDDIINLVLGEAWAFESAELVSIAFCELEDRRVGEVENVLKACFRVELREVEVARSLIVEGLVSEDGNFAVTQGFEFAFTINQGVDQVDDFFALAIHAQSNSGSLIVVYECA